MPKMKTKSSAKKRFRVRPGGTVKRGQAFKRHILTKKTTKTVSPKYDPKAGKPKKAYTRSERQKLMRQGERELERRVRDAEAEKQGKNPKDVKLKNFSRTWATNK